MFDVCYLFPFDRKLFDNFDPSSIAQFNEKKLLSLKVNGNLLLSEPKLRAIVENAKQILKVIQIKLVYFLSLSYHRKMLSKMEDPIV